MGGDIYPQRQQCEGCVKGVGRCEGREAIFDIPGVGVTDRQTMARRTVWWSTFLVMFLFLCC